MIESLLLSSPFFARFLQQFYMLTHNPARSDVATPSGFVRIEPVEMSGDDRYRNGQRQNAGDRTGRSDHLSERAHRYLVAVSHRRHGDTVSMATVVMTTNGHFACNTLNVNFNAMRYISSRFTHFYLLDLYRNRRHGDLIFIVQRCHSNQQVAVL